MASCSHVGLLGACAQPQSWGHPPDPVCRLILSIVCSVRVLHLILRCLCSTFVCRCYFVPFRLTASTLACRCSETVDVFSAVFELTEVSGGPVRCPRKIDSIKKVGWLTYPAKCCHQQQANAMKPGACSANMAHMIEPLDGCPHVVPCFISIYFLHVSQHS